MAITIQCKRDTAANWTSNNPTLASGEFGFETDTGKFKVGDGSTAWSSLGYFEAEAAVVPYTFQGSTSGYTSGYFSSGTPPAETRIDKFPFSSDGNATDVGDLTVLRFSTHGGQSSSASGYTSGGYDVPLSGYSDVIDKFPFASDTDATDVGNLTVARSGHTGQSSSESGYNSGGNNPTAPTPGRQNVIDKFSFSTDADATDVGDLISVSNLGAGQSSDTNGYFSGGNSAPGTILNVISKFPFSSDANATDVGDMTTTRQQQSGQSSTTNGYNSGGSSPVSGVGYFCNIIDKYPFSSDANATDVGDLLTQNYYSAGQSSTANGYASGGVDVSVPASTNTIQKFPFSSDANATDVGDLTGARSGQAGQQV